MDSEKFTMEDFVTYEQAIELKELGFDWETHTFYNKEGDLYSSDNPDYWNDEIWNEFSAPTISQVQKWFFEEKRIYIEIYCANNLTDFGYELKFDYCPVEKHCCQGYNSTNEALSKGIDDAIKYIKENG